MTSEVCSCGAPAVWYYMPDSAIKFLQRAYCEDHVPSRGCSCMGEDPELDEQGRPPPCCEYIWIGDTELENDSPPRSDDT